MQHEDIKKEYDPGLMNGNRCANDNMRDLDHMFDNSDDLSSDEAVAAVSIGSVVPNLFYSMLFL